MKDKETKIFRETGLNSDDDLDFMQNGDSRYRYLMGFINGDYDTLIPRRVPEVLGLTLPPVGTNIIIGACEDKENNAAIIFMYNSNRLHYIIRVYSDGTQENIVDSQSSLEFNPFYPIYKPTIVDGNLIWTDYNEPPRSINIDKFVTGAYTTPDRGNSYLHRPSPLIKPSLTLSYDSSVDYSKLAGNLFQFCYRWVYENGQKSVVSPFSDTVFDYQDDFFDETTLDVVDNYIQVAANATYWGSIEKVEFFVRELDVGSGASGFWKHFSTVAASEAVGTTVTTDFYNEEDGIVYTDAEINRLSDSVPFKCRDIEFILGNRLALTDFNYGRDPITPNIALEQVGVELGDNTYVNNDEINTDILTATDTGDFDIKLLYNQENHVIVELVSVDATSILYKETHRLKSDYEYSTTQSGSYWDNGPVINALVSLINNNTEIEGLTASLTAGTGTDDVLTIATSAAGGFTGTNLHVAVFACPVRSKLRSMKENSKSYFGITYFFPDGRESRVYLDDATNIQIERGTSANSNIIEEQIGVKYTISHLPPTGATKWQWCYGGSSIPYWFYVPARYHAERHDETGPPDVTRSTYMYKLNLSQAVTRVSEDMGYNIQTFTPVVGDYVRLVGRVGQSSDTVITPLAQQELNLITKVEVDGNGDTIVYFDVSALLPLSPTIMLEISRRQEITNPEDRVYYEVGDRLDILNGYHVCSVPSDFTGEVTAVNQSGIASGVGVIDFGNCYIYPNYWMFTFDQRAPETDDNMVAIISRGEFMSSYITQDSSNYGQGRANYSDADESNKDYVAIMAGGTYKETDLEYNELNKFTLGTNTVYLNEKFGPAYSVLESGKTLYAFQRSKVTRIRLGERLTQNANNQVIVSVADVFGSIDPFEEDFGTMYPGSITKYGNRIWFFDALNGSLFQIAQDGITDISRFGQKLFFTQLSQTIGKDYTNYDFYSFYDIITETYVLIYREVYNPSANWSRSYYPLMRKWGCTENYGTQGGISIGGNKVFSFNAGVYEHHKSDAAYEEGYIDAHLSNPVLVRKLYRYLEVDSPYLYSVKTFPSIWVDTDMPDYKDTNTYVHTGGEQQSLIPDSEFKRVNGKFRAAFLRNILLNDGTQGPDSKILNGDKLAGKHITVRLKNTQTVYENPLRAVTVGHQRKV